MFNLEMTEPQTQNNEAVVIDYLNSKAGTRYRCGKGNTKFITARLKDGFTVKDMKDVIDQRIEAWKDTEMSKYLRPATLFNDEKFNQYFGQLGLKIVKEVKLPRTHDECDAEGRRLGMPPFKGETYPKYKERLIKAMRAKLDE